MKHYHLEVQANTKKMAQKKPILQPGTNDQLYFHCYLNKLKHQFSLPSSGSNPNPKFLGIPVFFSVRNLSFRLIKRRNINTKTMTKILTGKWPLFSFYVCIFLKVILHSNLSNFFQTFYFLKLWSIFLGPTLCQWLYKISIRKHRLVKGKFTSLAG